MIHAIFDQKARHSMTLIINVTPKETDRKKKSIAMEPMLQEFLSSFFHIFPHKHVYATLLPNTPTYLFDLGKIC